MNNILHTPTVTDYNRWAGVETLNPLISFIDFSKVEPIRHVRKLYGLYAIFLKQANCGELKYGRKTYDYQEGTLLFVAPGQVFGAEDDGELFQPTGYVLLFHPDLLRGTPLASAMKDYTFFNYEENEALHLSERERKTVMDCLGKINEELQYPVDKFSKTILTDSIKTFLDYCTRFYSRQFITRENVNSDTLAKFENLLNEYFASDKPSVQGLPNVQWCASQLGMSSNYLSDMLKRETGMTALNYIHSKLLDIAKNEIVATSKTISEIAYRLGFQYPQHFTRLFKRVVGCSPNEYRQQFAS